MKGRDGGRVFYPSRHLFTAGCTSPLTQLPSCGATRVRAAAAVLRFKAPQRTFVHNRFKIQDSRSLYCHYAGITTFCTTPGRHTHKYTHKYTQNTHINKTQINHRKYIQKYIHVQDKKTTWMFWMDGSLDGWMMDGYMDGWMDGLWMDGWNQCMDGWMNYGCMHEWMDGWWMNGCMAGWLDGWINGWMDGWMNGWWMDEWMDGWMDDGCMAGWLDGWMDG